VCSQVDVCVFSMRINEDVRCGFPIEEGSKMWGRSEGSKMWARSEVPQMVSVHLQALSSGLTVGACLENKQAVLRVGRRMHG